jgi:hypothetical protein
MSAQTPQTDAAQIDGWLDGADDYYGKSNWVAADFARGLERDRDRLKALCEELKGALEVCADVFHAEGWRHLEESARAALKKAEKP